MASNIRRYGLGRAQVVKNHSFLIFWEQWDRNVILNVQGKNVSLIPPAPLVSKISVYDKNYAFFWMIFSLGGHRSKSKGLESIQAQGAGSAIIHETFGVY